MGLLELEHISHSYGQSGTYGSRRGHQVLFDVSLSLEPGGILALVGESGCGKTTVAKIAADVVVPTEGRVRYENRDLRRLGRSEYLVYRRGVQYIHQDPYASLNPTRTVFDTLSAPLRRHKIARGRGEQRLKVDELLTAIGLAPTADYRDKYPHQLSGGQRQRVSMARAMALDPTVIIADEAVSMVDVSLRVELLNILLAMQRRLNNAYLFVSHDFGVVRYFAQGQTTAVMYLGHVVEIGPTSAVIARPLHPYTQALLAAVPVADPTGTGLDRPLPVRSAEPPTTPAAIAGCKFHPRCLYATDICRQQIPPLEEMAPGHRAACFHARELMAGGAAARPGPTEDAILPASPPREPVEG
ncbi:MAG TPA: ABC transporter ATP-binding protein [Chloroflexota bacterium]